MTFTKPIDIYVLYEGQSHLSNRPQARREGGDRGILWAYRGHTGGQCGKIVTWHIMAKGIMAKGTMAEKRANWSQNNNGKKWLRNKFIGKFIWLCKYHFIFLVIGGLREGLQGGNGGEVGRWGGVRSPLFFVAELTKDFVLSRGGGGAKSIGA
jgi:hypothetical protein